MAAEEEEVPLNSMGDEEEVSEAAEDSAAADWEIAEDREGLLVLVATAAAAVPYTLAALQYDIFTCWALKALGSLGQSL